MAGLINELDNLLVDEKNARQSYNARAESIAQKQMVKIIQAIGKTGDINLIMTAEKAINVHELEFYTNSKPMESSLKQTLTSINITNKCIDVIQNKPDEYKIRAQSYEETKNQLNGLPLDEARQFFKSQSARFVNMDKSPLSNDKKATIEARKFNVRLAGDIYIDLQKATLGLKNTIAPKPNNLSL